MKHWKWSPAASLGIFIGLISLYRLMMARALSITPDEAYYFAWSRRPAWCYYDQPAMVAWVDWLFARPFAHPTAFTARLAAVVLGALSTWLFYRLYREYRDDRHEAVVFAASFSLLPFTWITGFMIIHDTTLLPWLTLAVWMIVRLARHDGQARDWLVLAVALTGAMYAKFSAVMIAWGIFLYMVWSPKGRRWWRTWPPYAAAALSAVLYLPVLHWNYVHDFVSLQAIRELTDVTPPTLGRRLGFMAEYISGQVGMFSPLIGLIVFGALFKGVRDAWRDSTNDEVLLPVCLAAPIFAYFLYQSTYTHVYGNWPGIGYLPLGLLGMKEVMDRARGKATWSLFSPRFAAVGLGLNLLLLVTLSLHMQFNLFGPLLRGIESKYDLHRRIDWRLDQDFRGWDEMVKLAEAGRDRADFILTSDYQTASMLEFLLPDQPLVEGFTKGKRGNQWDLWSTLDRRIGQTALYIDEKKLPPPVRKRCEEVKTLVEYQPVGDPERPIKKWRSYLCIGWKGPGPVEKPAKKGSEK